MRKQAYVAVVVAVMVFLVGMPLSWGKMTTIRMSSEWPAGDARNALIEKTLIKPFNDEAAGKAKIELYGAGELTKAMNMMDAMDSRLVDMGVTKLAGGWPTVVPALALLSLPVFDGPAHTYKALAGDLGGYLDQVTQKKVKVKIVGYLTAGEVEAMGCVSKLFKTPGDLKGLKLRAGSKTDAVSCESFGAIPTIIDSGEMYLALQRGTVEGVFITIPQMVLKTKIIEVCRNWTQIPIVSGIQFGVVSNLEVWSELPKDLQAKLTALAGNLREAMAVNSREAADKGWQAIKKTPGASVYSVPAEQVEQWTRIMGPAQLNLLEQLVPPEEATRLLGLVDKARK